MFVILSHVAGLQKHKKRKTDEARVNVDGVALILETAFGYVSDLTSEIENGTIS